MTGVFIIEGQYDDVLNDNYGVYVLTEGQAGTRARSRSWCSTSSGRAEPPHLTRHSGAGPRGVDFVVNGRLRPKVQMQPGESPALAHRQHGGTLTRSISGARGRLAMAADSRRTACSSPTTNYQQQREPAVLRGARQPHRPPGAGAAAAADAQQRHPGAGRDGAGAGEADARQSDHDRSRARALRCCKSPCRGDRGHARAASRRR